MSKLALALRAVSQVLICMAWVAGLGAQPAALKENIRPMANASGECNQAVANVVAAGNITLIACPRYSVELDGVVKALERLQRGGQLQRNQLQQVVDSINAMFAILLRRENQTLTALGNVEKSVRAMSEILERRLATSSTSSLENLANEFAGLKTTYEDVLAEWQALKSEDPTAAKVHAALERFDLGGATALIEESLRKQQAGLAARHRSLAQLSLVRGDGRTALANYQEAVRLDPLKYGIELIEMMERYYSYLGYPKRLVEEQAEAWRTHAAQKSDYDPTIRLQILERGEWMAKGDAGVAFGLERLSVLKVSFGRGDRRFRSALVNALLSGPLPDDYFRNGVRSKDKEEECYARERASREALSLLTIIEPAPLGIESLPAARVRVSARLAEVLDSCGQREAALQTLERELDRPRETDGNISYALSGAMRVLAQMHESDGDLEKARQWFERRLSLSMSSSIERISAFADAAYFYVRHQRRSLAYERCTSAVDLMRNESTAEGRSAFRAFSMYPEMSLCAATLALATRGATSGLKLIDQFNAEQREFISSIRRTWSPEMLKAQGEIPNIDLLRETFLENLMARPNWLDREGDKDGGCQIRYLAGKLLGKKPSSPSILDSPDFCAEATQ